MAENEEDEDGDCENETNYDALMTECADMYTNMNALRYTKSADDDRECELEVE